MSPAPDHQCCTKAHAATTCMIYSESGHQRLSAPLVALPASQPRRVHHPSSPRLSSLLSDSSRSRVRRHAPVTLVVTWSHVSPDLSPVGQSDGQLWHPRHERCIGCGLEGSHAEWGYRGVLGVGRRGHSARFVVETRAIPSLGHPRNHHARVEHRAHGTTMSTSSTSAPGTSSGVPGL